MCCLWVCPRCKTLEELQMLLHLEVWRCAKLWEAALLQQPFLGTRIKPPDLPSHEAALDARTHAHPDAHPTAALHT